jgi:hypothetical protein
MDTERNKTLNIDYDSRDLTFDEGGMMELIYSDVTTAQCVRLTLQTWKAEFFLDTTHGTEYDRILGKRPHELPKDEVGEVLREAIFQEPDIRQIETMDAEVGNDRQPTATFAATLYSGQTISMEVTA